MRKIFTLLAAMLCSLISFAQDLQLETKDGQVIENGSEITIKGEMVDEGGYMGTFTPHLYVRNLTDENQGIYAQMKAIKGYPQICGISNCYPTSEQNPIATTGMGLLPASSTIDLQIHTQHLAMFEPNYLTDIHTCTIEITVWTDKKPEEKVTATVTFTNDPTLSIENSEVKAHTVYAKDNVLYYNFPYAANRQLQVYNVAGNLCQNIRLTSEAGALHLEGMSKGIYLYRIIEGGNKGASGKLLVK